VLVLLVALAPLVLGVVIIAVAVVTNQLAVAQLAQRRPLAWRRLGAVRHPIAQR